MTYTLKVFCLALVFPALLAVPRNYVGWTSKTMCQPQETPIFGEKWCSFNKHQAEVGSVCMFSCIKGFHLRGPRVTECIVGLNSKYPMYNDTFGFCEPNAPILHKGRNGPYLVHSYDPSAYVIHVDDGKEVTLKSYYYLAMYIQSPGLNGIKNTVSILVQGPKGRYIKANETHIYTDNIGLGTDTEKSRATFWLRNDKFFEGYTAFESYEKSNYYMVHKSRKIYLSEVKNSEDRVCASFIWSPDL